MLSALGIVDKFVNLEGSVRSRDTQLSAAERATSLKPDWAKREVAAAAMGIVFAGTGPRGVCRVVWEVGVRSRGLD